MAETSLGTIASSGATKNNSDTAVPFTIQPGSYIALQGDAPFYYATGTASSLTVTSAGLRVDTNVAWPVYMEHDQVYVAILPVSGSANVKVYAVKDGPAYDTQVAARTLP